MRNVSIAVWSVGLLCAVSTAPAVAWTVFQWGDSGLSYRTDEEFRSIVLESSGTYKFYALEGTELDSIGPITVEPGVTGTVTLHIARPSGQTGVVDLGSINLDNAGTGKLAECRVQHDAAVSGDIIVDQLTGPFVIGHDVVHDVTAGTVANTPVVTINGDCAGTLTIGGGTVQIFSLTLGSLSGSCTVPFVSNSAGITVNGGISGMLHVTGTTWPVTIHGDISSTGTARFDDTITERLQVDGNVDGLLDVRKDVTEYNGMRQLHCVGSVNGTLEIGATATNYVFASIQVDHDVTGVIRVKKQLRANDHLTDPALRATYGHVRVLGSLGADGDSGEIILEGGMADSQPSTPLQAYVCINYDGDGRHAGGVEDRWYSGTVTVGSTPYGEPDNAARVHLAPASCGRGDTNGDAEVTFADIDGFVELLGVTAAEYPGRQPSRIWMADASCDGAVTFADIDPFVELLGDPCSSCNEALLGGGTQLAASAAMSMADSASGGSSPQTVASYLAANVSAANYDTLLDAVDYVAMFPPVDPSTDWAQVAALLSGE